MMRRIAAAMGFLCDVIVLLAALCVVVATYQASVVEPLPVHVPQEPVEPPQVDWSDSYELWRGNTGDWPGWRQEQPPQPEPIRQSARQYRTC